jgi:hypothetical protein
VHHLTVAGLGQLIVGGSSHDIDLKVVQRIVVDDTPQSAWCEDVGVDRKDICCPHGFGAEFLHDTSHPPVIDVRNGEACSVRVEVFTQIVSDVSEALHGHVFATQGTISITELGACLDPAVDTEGRDG